MSDIIRYGAEGGVGQGRQHMPFSRAVQADGWLYVSGQVPMQDGELLGGPVTEQAHAVIRSVLAILAEAGYGPEHVVRCGVWLDDARDFAAFNAVFRHYFGTTPSGYRRYGPATTERSGRGTAARVGDRL